ncbi:hypothetical protein [Microbispora rosea]|uniref:hypothetical protein n=1 Tax=Microbispora rosea TaxID=58117 RepID=UPI0037A27F41
MLLLARHLINLAIPEDTEPTTVNDAILLSQAQAALKNGNCNSMQAWERETLLRAACLQLHVQSAVAAVNGRTLNLDEELEQVGGLYETLSRIRSTSELLHTGQVEAPYPEGESPTVREVQRWRELAVNDELRHRTKVREAIATSAEDPRYAPERWKITCYQPNGYLEAHYLDDQATRGPTHGAWVSVPEAVPEVLRRWSVPATRAVEVAWECEPEQPDRLLPFSGWLPGHRNNDPEHMQQVGIAISEVWNANGARNRDRFEEMMHQLRLRWPRGQSVADFLRDAATRLNAAQPQAPALGSRLTFAGHDDDAGDLVGLGYSVTAGWIDPAAVAETGTRLWNDFARHRPRTVPAMAKALLSGNVDRALEVWSLCTEPITVVRVHGPAGPLYHLHYNGAHRLHAARLLGLPGIWVEMEQHALPLQLTFADVRQNGEYNQAGDVITCWRGLQARGLLVGELEEDSTWPVSSILHLDTVVAPWLLARPENAIAWAAIYDRVYPGALHEAGVPAAAWQSVQAWLSWLSVEQPR